jgi:hypothetical protein
MQVEQRSYPTSFQGADNATFERLPDQLRAVPEAVAPDGFFKISLSYRPHYAYDETSVDHTLFWLTSTTKVFFRQSDQKIILQVSGQDIVSSALTFSRHQELRVTAEHTSDGGRRLVVQGATTGNGVATGSVLGLVTLGTYACVLGSEAGSEEGADLLVFDAQTDWSPGLIEKNEDHEGRVSRFIDRWRREPDLTQWAKIYLRQLQDIEDALFEIMLERLLDNAVGVQLTILGKLVQQARTTSDDDKFRTTIRARIAINLSDSTAEDLIKVAGLLLQEYSETFRIRDEPPAQVRITVVDLLQSADPYLMKDLLDEADPGGVRLLLNWTTSVATSAFRFDDSGGAANISGGGFADSLGGGTSPGFFSSVAE